MKQRICRVCGTPYEITSPLGYACQTCSGECPESVTILNTPQPHSAEADKARCSFCGEEPHQIKDCPACKSRHETLDLYLSARKKIARLEAAVDAMGDNRKFAISNCYMMARRCVARLKRENPNDLKSFEEWGHIIRFCESTGEKPQLLRDSIPRDIQGG